MRYVALETLVNYRKVRNFVLSGSILIVRRMVTLYAAPLQGFTESAWRNAHAQVFGGVDAYYTPFVRLEKGGIRNKDRRELLPAGNSVPRLIPQLVAAGPDEFRILVEQVAGWGYREIDLNMGCPFPLIVNRKKGSGLLPFPDKVAALLRQMEAFPEIRFSIKMRLGWEHNDEWKEILPLLNGSCVRQLTLHPRIGKQQYKGTIDREAFSAFYEACRLPLVYNGDLRTPDEMQEILQSYPRLEGLMLGRGLLANPALAADFRQGSPSSVSDLHRKVGQMHRLICAEYARTLEGGEAQILQKLKTFWDYCLPDLDKKARKAILKSNRLDAYLRAVDEAL